MRKSKIKILVGVLSVTVIILIAMIAIIFIGKRIMDGYKTQIEDMQWEMDANKQTVYVASKDITAGEAIEEGTNVYTQQIYTGLDSNSYISSEDLGNMAIVDIPEGEPVMKNVVSPLAITKDAREYEIAVASLMTDQRENDFVDVRILFPNGEDFIILPKKQVINLSLDNSVFYTYMNEDEILRMASAIIDAYTISGTRIYTSRYIESNLQEEATPTYVVKSSTIDLINKDPNITRIASDTLNLQARMDLETRLKGLTEEQLKAVTAGHALEDTAKNSVLLESIYDTTPEEGIVTDEMLGEEEDEVSDDKEE